MAASRRTASENEKLKVQNKGVSSNFESEVYGESSIHMMSEAVRKQGWKLFWFLQSGSTSKKRRKSGVEGTTADRGSCGPRHVRAWG